MLILSKERRKYDCRSDATNLKVASLIDPLILARTSNVSHHRPIIEIQPSAAGS